MVLTVCAKTTKNDYKFIGESEYAYRGTEVWGETNGKKTYSNKDSYEFVLKYKGVLEELSSMKRLEYSYETNFSNGEVTEEYTEPTEKVLFTTSGASSGAKVSVDEVIQVNVKWDNFEELFELHNKSK